MRLHLLSATTACLVSLGRKREDSRLTTKAGTVLFLPILRLSGHQLWSDEHQLLLPSFSLHKQLPFVHSRNASPHVCISKGFLRWVSPKVDWNILNLPFCWQPSESSQWNVHHSRSSLHLHRLAMHVTDCSAGELEATRSWLPHVLTKLHSLARLLCNAWPATGMHSVARLLSLVSETC